MSLLGLRLEEQACRVPARNHPSVLIRKYHGNMPVAKPLDDIRRRSILAKDAHDNANPVVAIVDDQPVTHPGSHDAPLTCASSGNSRPRSGRISALFAGLSYSAAADEMITTGHFE